jgi:hypothetical protein
VAVDQLARLQERAHAIKIRALLLLQGEACGWGWRWRRALRKTMVEVMGAPDAMMGRKGRARMVVAWRARFGGSPVVRRLIRPAVRHGESRDAIRGGVRGAGLVVDMVRASVV